MAYAAAPNMPNGAYGNAPPPAQYGAPQPGQYANAPPPGQYGNVPQAQVPQANLSPAGLRVLHIYCDGLLGRRIRIMDADKVTQLYDIQSNAGTIFNSKPHMRITNTQTGQEIGTVSFHQISLSIDLVLHGQPCPFYRPNVLAASHQYNSPALGGQPLTWKRDGIISGGDLKCVDAQNNVFGLFDNNLFSWGKDGRFEVSPTLQGPLLDELVVSGIAAMEFHKRQERKRR